jgi:CHAT domain-containing protein
LFADGPLTLDRLFAGAISLSGTSLVTLSGCETSLTDPKDLADEWLGIASGFLFAGAHMVVSTLWSVDDLSSGMLLSAFYQKYLGEHLPADRALREAQRWLRDKVNRKEALRFVDTAISHLQKQCTAFPKQTELTGIMDRQLKRLQKQKQSLKIRGDRYPFSRPFFWASYTVSGGDPSALLQ